MNNYQVEVEFKGLPDNAKVSARHVQNIDLAERGGWALLGTFVKNHNPKDDIFKFSSHLPIVLMITIPEAEKAFVKRAALLFISSDEKTDQVSEASFDYEGLKVKARVSDGGTVFGFYMPGQRVTIADNLVAPQTAPNPYYQIAMDLARLQEEEIVVFPKQPEPIIKHNDRESVYAKLPKLPSGFEWGPEIGGILTVKKVLDPYSLYFFDSIIEHIGAEKMKGELKKELAALLTEQAQRMNDMSKAYGYMPKVYLGEP